jgi:hypothetical protein
MTIQLVAAIKTLKTTFLVHTKIKKSSRISAPKYLFLFDFRAKNIQMHLRLTHNEEAKLMTENDRT